MDDLGALARLIDALRPWLRDLVIVGGWAHRLHRLHPLARTPSYQALQTQDVDLAFAQRARLAGDIGSALRAAGFHEELSGNHEPPVSQYTFGSDNRGFYAEFLTPLSGSGTRRDGTPDDTLGKAGITAQKVRHLDLLLIHTWSVPIGQRDGVSLPSDAMVSLPNAATFIAQRLLIHDRREPGKQAQDVLYIHDTLELFGGSVEALKAVWQDHVRPRIDAARAEEIELLGRERFTRVTDVVRAAARIRPDRRLSPEGIRALCSYGIRQILGD